MPSKRHPTTGIAKFTCFPELVAIRFFRSPPAFAHKEAGERRQGFSFAKWQRKPAKNFEKCRACRDELITKVSDFGAVCGGIVVKCGSCPTDKEINRLQDQRGCVCEKEAVRGNAWVFFRQKSKHTHTHIKQYWRAWLLFAVIDVFRRFPALSAAVVFVRFAILFRRRSACECVCVCEVWRCVFETIKLRTHAQKTPIHAKIQADGKNISKPFGCVGDWVGVGEVVVVEIRCGR